MRSPVALAFTLAVALGSGLAMPARAQLVRIPGTTVTLTAPPGFVLSRKFPGLENPDTGSSITILEYAPERYAELAAAFTSPKTAASRFDAEGVRITRVEQFSADSGTIPVAIGSQETRNKEVDKYFALFGGTRTDTKTVLVTLSIAESSELGHSGIESILRSVTLGHVQTIDEKVAKLPFTFKAVAPFHAGDVLPGDIVTLPSFDGRDPSGQKPIILIGRSPTSATPSETQQTAERILRNTGGLADAMITEQEPVPFAGGQGYFIAAVAGERTILQYLIVLPGGTYLRLMARGATDAIGEARPVVKEIADSVELTR